MKAPLWIWFSLTVIFFGTVWMHDIVQIKAFDFSKVITYVQDKISKTSFPISSLEFLIPSSLHCPPVEWCNSNYFSFLQPSSSNVLHLLVVHVIFPAACLNQTGPHPLQWLAGLTTWSLRGCHSTYGRVLHLWGNKSDKNVSYYGDQGLLWKFHQDLPFGHISQHLEGKKYRMEF